MTRRHCLCSATALAAVALSTPTASLHAQAAMSQADPRVVEVIAEDYAFEAPDQIPSGWTTFRLSNEGQEHHFIFLTRLPEGTTYDDYMVELGGPYEKVLKALNAGEVDKAQALGMLGPMLPAWFGSAKQMGGTGLLAPGGVAQATLNLMPGEYILECYMKTAEGEIHAMEGMARPLRVTEVSSDVAPPAADVQIRLSNYDIAAPEQITPGVHTVAVHFDEHPEAGFGHDVHLARLGEGTDVAEIVPWMDWFNVQGLRNPAPATFVGGTHEMPEGYTAYFTVNLSPGRYAWISESAPDRMLKEFIVR